MACALSLQLHKSIHAQDAWDCLGLSARTHTWHEHPCHLQPATPLRPDGSTLLDITSPRLVRVLVYSGQVSGQHLLRQARTCRRH